MVSAIDKIEAFVHPFYEQRDTMHGMAHVRRVLKEAQALSRSHPGTDATIIAYGAYLHGIIWNTEEERIATFLRSHDLPEDMIQRILRVAWESLKEKTPHTLEGKILHDAHLIEGGRTFIIVKSLVVGAVRGQTIEDTVEYMEGNVLGKYRCYLPEAQMIYAEKEAFARAFLEDLKTNL